MERWTRRCARSSRNTWPAAIPAKSSSTISVRRSRSTKRGNPTNYLPNSASGSAPSSGSDGKKRTLEISDYQRAKDPKQNMPLKVIVIGGVAAGPKAASKIMRLNPQAEVTIIEKGKFISYAGCGLPYYVSGTVKEQRDLMSTPIGVVRDPAFFQ